MQNLNLPPGLLINSTDTAIANELGLIKPFLKYLLMYFLLYLFFALTMIYNSAQKVLLCL